jgi:hypothetical protein
LTIKKTFTCAIAALALALGATAVAIPAAVSAHTPEAKATCSTLTVELENYSVGDNGALVNSVSVEIDSTVVDEADFGTSLHETYPLGDTTVAHEYVVEIDASGTQYDRDFSGTSVPCPRAAAPDASATLTVTPATCDAPGTLVLGDVQNATWGTPVGATGPGRYTVVATADAGHTFPDGTTSQSFDGPLDGALDATAYPCATTPVVPDRPAPARTVSDTTNVDCASMTQTTTTTTTTTDWALDTATNTWVATAPVVTTANATAAAQPGDCLTTTAVTPPTPIETPSVPSVPTDTSARAVSADTLASTGSDAATVAPVGVVILLAGAALLLLRRLTAKRAERP